MPKITTEAGPWNMTVFAFDQSDPENPLGSLKDEDLRKIPYGAAELNAEGRIISYIDTEPEGNDNGKVSPIGRDFFGDVARWASSSIIAAEFRKGISGGALNVVFDCASARLPHKVRVHFKVSPILGTYWVFVKRLHRA
jgi:photoactive yellow protein